MSSTSEDFGGDSPAEKKRKLREARASAGLCRECGAPVKIKSNGKPARVCEDHASADRKRKG